MKKNVLKEHLFYEPVMVATCLNPGHCIIIFSKETEAEKESSLQLVCSWQNHVRDLILADSSLFHHALPQHLKYWQKIEAYGSDISS